VIDSAPTVVEEQRPRSSLTPQASPNPRASGLRVAQGAVVAVIAGALPVAAVARFGFDTDRGSTADVAGVVFFVAIVALLTTPWWPVPSQRGRTRFERIQSTCFLWFGVTYTTHLTWELWWLLLHDRIVASPDAPWAYAWWMYIDGGDGRYATADPTLVTQEILSVVNGIVGLTALWLWWRSKGRSPAAPLLFMATAVVHLYSTAVYFGSELFDGYPNVDTDSFVDFWIKFWLLNGLWLVVPWLVLYWGWRTLQNDR
jgi:hypothetical protein